MSAAAVILRDLTYIYLSFGTETHFKLLRTYLMEKDCDFNALCLTQLAYDPFKIRGLRLKKPHGFLPYHGYDTFLIHDEHTLKKGASKDLVLYVALLVICLINDLAAVDPFAHQLCRSLHCLRRCAGILKHTRIMNNSHIKGLCRCMADLIPVYHIIYEF